MPSIFLSPHVIHSFIHSLIHSFIHSLALSSTHSAKPCAAKSASVLTSSRSHGPAVTLAQSVAHAGQAYAVVLQSTVSELTLNLATGARMHLLGPTGPT